MDSGDYVWYQGANPCGLHARLVVLSLQSWKCNQFLCIDFIASYFAVFVVSKNFQVVSLGSSAYIMMSGFLLRWNIEIMQT